MEFLKEHRTNLLWRSLLAFTLLGCARYGVWYVHSQHVAYAASRGLTEAELWHDCAHDPRSSFYDYFVQMIYPLTSYFAENPRARNALVQFVTGLELILVGANVGLFVIYDVWILLQTTLAVTITLAINSASWTPMLCDAVRLPVGEAWLSDALAGGIRQLPLGGLSTSTTMVALGLYNVYARRRAADVAFLHTFLLALYMVYHMVLRWHSLLDELFALLLATTLILTLYHVRVLYNVDKIVKQVENYDYHVPVTPRTPVTQQKSPRLTLSLQDTLRAYHTSEELGSRSVDVSNDVTFPPDEEILEFQRGGLHEIHIYENH